MIEATDRSVGRRVMEAIFQAHASIYVLVNALMVFIWFAAGRGTFWPVWTMGPWGFALAIHAWLTWGLTFWRG